MSFEDHEEHMSMLRRISTQLGAMPTIQQVYDMIFPVGYVSVTGVKPVIPTGVKADWEARLGVGHAVHWQRV